MPTLEEIGKATKAKYPQYQGKSDTEVGQAVVDKYPEYKAKLTAVPTIQKVADFLGLGNTERTLASIFGTPELSKATTAEGARSSEAFKQSSALIKQAQIEKDPVKKKALIDQSRSIMQGSAGQSEQYSRQLEQSQINQGIGERELGMSSNEFALRRGAGTAAEVGSYLLPGAVTGAKAATMAGRVGQGAIQGAVSGGLQGVAGSAKESDTLQETAFRTAGGTALGAGLGAVITYGVEKIGQKLAERAAGKAAEKATTQVDDISNKIAETRDIAKNKKFSNQDRTRALQFNKYKNRTNMGTNDIEAARVLDDLKIKYKSTDELPGKAQELVSTIQDIKNSTMKQQGGVIDTTKTANIFKKEAQKALGSNPAKINNFYKSIVEEFADVDGLAGADPVRADQFAASLGDQARKYFTSARDPLNSSRVISPENEALYRGFNAAKNYIREQIDKNFAKSISYNPQALEVVEQLSKPLAEGFKNKSVSMTDLNYLQAMLMEAQKLAFETRIASTGAGQVVSAGKGALRIPGISQLLDVGNAAADVALYPTTSTMRTQTAKNLANLPGLFQQLAQGAKNLPGNVGAGVGRVTQAGLSKPSVTINPAVAAMQRAIENTKKNKLPGR